MKTVECVQYVYFSLACVSVSVQSVSTLLGSYQQPMSVLYISIDVVKYCTVHVQYRTSTVYCVLVVFCTVHVQYRTSTVYSVLVVFCTVHVQYKTSTVYSVLVVFCTVHVQ